MQHGDIANSPDGEVIYVIWEGLLALPTAQYSATRFRRRLRFRGPGHALDLYETHDLAVLRLWELWHQDQRVVVVTYLGERIAPALAERLEADAVPCGGLITTTVSQLASHIALDPGIRYIADPDPQRRFTYGSKGRTVAPHDAALIGRLL
jgi:hypothetical protein